MSALQSRGYEAKWFDKRKPLSILVVENIFGFVLNVPSNFRVVGIVPLPFLKQKHWIALKSVGSSFYNLDSNLKKPEELGKVSCNRHQSPKKVHISFGATRGVEYHNCLESKFFKDLAQACICTEKSYLFYFRSMSFLLSSRYS